MGLWYQKIKGGKQALVFLHGAGSNHTIWNPYLQSFSKESVLLVDLPGHGHSQRTQFRTIPDAARELISILKKEDIENAHVIGQSLGGLVGLEAAAKAPHQISRIAVSGLLSNGLIRSQTFIEVTASILLKYSPTQSLEKPFQDYSQQSNKWFFLYPFMDAKGTSLKTIARAIKEVASYSPPWTEISQPVLILNGRTDPFLKQQHLRKQIQGRPLIRMQTIACHHLVITHARNHVICALKGFLA